jgi:hypothetical protein
VEFSRIMSEFLERGRPDHIRRRPPDGIFRPTQAHLLGESAGPSPMIRQNLGLVRQIEID